MQSAAKSIETALAFDLRATWQARLLLEARGKLAAVVLSVLSHNFDDAMEALLKVVFPGFTSIAAPFLCSAGKVAKNGTIVADMISREGHKHSQVPLFPSEIALRDEFRKLADTLKLSDTDRVEMFQAVKNWVVCDYRLDPTMDPQDPDAKRLVVH